MEKDDCKKGNEAMGAGVQATPKVKATEVLFRVEGRKNSCDFRAPSHPFPVGFRDAVKV